MVIIIITSVICHETLAANDVMGKAYHIGISRIERKREERTQFPRFGRHSHNMYFDGKSLLYGLTARVRLFGYVGFESPRLSVIRCALYRSAECVSCSRKIGLWLSISITRTDWLRSRAAYSPGVHTGNTGVTYTRERIRRILPGKSPCSMITYYTATSRQEQKKRLSKSLL